MNGEILQELEERLSNLEEKCFDGGQHQLEPFVYYGKKSNFENICSKCGGFKINPRGVYSRIGLLYYIDSERYRTLLSYSEYIKGKK